MHGSIVLTDLTAGYNRHPAVHHVSGRFEPGSLTAVVGPNGSGKSTLLKTLVGLLRPMGGKVDLGGLTPRELGYLPQMSEIDRSFPITVLDMVGFGHWNSLGAFGRMTPEHFAAARRALASVGLAGFEARAIGTLSAGQFQRMLFARLLLADAPVILLDEPFTSVDAKTTADLMGLILELNRAGRTVAAVIHDMDQARANFPSALLLAREMIAWGPSEHTLTPKSLDAARCMAEAWDEIAPPCPENPS